MDSNYKVTLRLRLRSVTLHPFPPALIRTIILNLVNLISLIFRMEHKTQDTIFFIPIVTDALFSNL